MVSLVLDRPEAVERMPVVTEKHVELHCRLPLRGLVIPLAYNLLLVLLCAGHGFLTRYEGPFTRTVPISGSKGGARDARPPPGVQILSFSRSFRQKFEK